MWKGRKVKNETDLKEALETFLSLEKSVVFNPFGLHDPDSNEQ